MASTLEDGVVRTQPVFCLVKARLAESLVRFLLEGDRKVDRWTARHRVVEVRFDDAAAFFNANTPAGLALLQAPAPPRRARGARPHVGRA